MAKANKKRLKRMKIKNKKKHRRF
jgi:hypothetical protein